MDDRRLFIEVLSAAAVVDRLSALDETGLLIVSDSPGPAALVLSGVEDRRADVVVDGSARVDAVWSERIAPFARRFAGIEPPQRTPPVLEESRAACSTACASTSTGGRGYTTTSARRPCRGCAPSGSSTSRSA
jgi:hypothetical protein